MLRLFGLAVLLCSIEGMAMASDVDLIKLPPPPMEGGVPLMQAFRMRHSTREFSAKPLPLRVLSALLWAADGVNRPESGRRTAPSAMDAREIAIYVATADGTYRFDAVAHLLRRVSAHDLRGLTGTQDFVAEAPVDLVYVADMQRMDTDAESRRFYSAADTGFIAENVYLFCASEGLATVVRGSINRKVLATALGLSPQQEIMLAQTVGYPK